MATMLDGAHFEALATVAFVAASSPPAFGHLLAAADRGVQVRLLIRADNLAGGLVQSLQSRGVDLGTLTDLQAKFRITDTTAMNGSANFTEASADRASEVATFFSPHTRPSCTICASCSTTTGSGRDPTDTAPANPRTRVSRSPTGNALTLRCNGRRKAGSARVRFMAPRRVQGRSAPPTPSQESATGQTVLPVTRTSRPGLLGNAGATARQMTPVEWIPHSEVTAIFLDLGFA